MEKGIAYVRGQQWAEYTCVTHFTEPRHGKYPPYSSYFHKINSGRNNNKTAALVNWVVFQHFAQIRPLMILKTHKSDMFFLLARQGRGFPMCTYKKKRTLALEKIVFGPKQPAQALHTPKPTEKFGKVFTSLWECTVEGGVDHLLISSSCCFSSGACVYVCQATSPSEPEQWSLTTQGVIEWLSGHFPS